MGRALAPLAPSPPILSGKQNWLFSVCPGLAPALGGGPPPTPSTLGRFMAWAQEKVSDPSQASSLHFTNIS